MVDTTASPNKPASAPGTDLSGTGGLKQSANANANPLERIRDAGSTATKNAGRAANAVADVKQPTLLPKGPSPIQKQHRDSRSQSDYVPVAIVFLTGDYKGQTLDLGLAVNEISNSQSVTWDEQPGDAIRPNCNFKKISSRTFNLKLVFYDLGEDIAHMAENVATLQQISQGSHIPPTLLLKQGDLIASPVVCTDFKTNYAQPHIGNKGYHHAESVDLTFKLLGGKGSEHALAPPLTSTPLTDWAQSHSQAERDKQGTLAVDQLLLSRCLSPSSNQQLGKLIENSQLADVNAIAALEPDAFIQGAIAGIFDKEIYQDSRIAAKVNNDLSEQMARGISGIGIEWVQAAKAIRAPDQGSSNNALLGLTKSVQPETISARGDFNAIRDALVLQDFGESSAVFSDSSRSAGDRLRKFGSCGLSLRQSNTPAVADNYDTKPAWQKFFKSLLGDEAAAIPENREKAVLSKINDTLNDKSITDDQIAKTFGLQTRNQVKQLRNGMPYTSRDQFQQNASRNNSGMTGYVIWSNFIDTASSTVAEGAKS